MKHSFKYVSKSDPHLKAAHKDAINLIKEVQNEVRSQLTFQYESVGSYVRNMVTYDAKSNIGYDLDFNLIVNDDQNQYSAKQIKNALQRAMNAVAQKHGYDYPEDSTRVLTLKCKDREHSKIRHSIDFAIIKDHIDKDGDIRRVCIQFDKRKSRYIWCEQPSGEYDLPERIALLKEEELWDELREYYLEKKNMNEDPDLHSRQLFSMAVNELMQKNGLLDEANYEKADIYEMYQRSCTPDVYYIDLRAERRRYNTKELRLWRTVNIM